MPGAKQVVRDVLDALPEDCSLEDVQYALYVRQRILEGERSASDGGLVAHEQVMREAREWLERQ